MSQERGQKVLSFLAGEAIAANCGVAIHVGAAANTVNLPGTTTSVLLGISQDTAASGGSLPVITEGSAKLILDSVVSAGNLVALNTNGHGTAATQLLNTTTTTVPRTIGIALESGVTNGVIEVYISRGNQKVVFA